LKVRIFTKSVNLNVHNIFSAEQFEERETNLSFEDSEVKHLLEDENQSFGGREGTICSRENIILGFPYLNNDTKLY
jgi:hypothetical protein